MRKVLIVFVALFSVLHGNALTAHAATRTGGTRTARSGAVANTGNGASQTAAYNYNYMYPYMNNQMRTTLNPGGVMPTGSNPINAVVHTETINSINNTRRVVPRPSPARAAGRVASTAAVAPTPARSAAYSAPAASSAGGRRVTARNFSRNVMARGATRGDASYTNQIAQNTAALGVTGPNLLSSQCLADYTKCMNGYCQRENTDYNRCYCSAKLAQIDAEYRPAIDKLVNQILTMKNEDAWSETELNEYWMHAVGSYTGTNSWQNIDDALDIDWASLESRTRGQQAFATGHAYCVQYLRGCYYMASNLRDIYRSEISRDCAAYEQSLQRLKTVAESIVESNQ